jgi:hypothetical protein
LLYCKERVVAGIANGIVFGDDTLGAMIVARPGEEDSVLHCAVEALRLLPNMPPPPAGFRVTAE